MRIWMWRGMGDGGGGERVSKLRYGGVQTRERV